MKLSRTDYLLIIGIAIIFLVGIFTIEFYFNYIQDDCISNPFIFGAKQMEDKTTGYFSGSGYIKTVKGFTALTFHFNSSSFDQVRN